MSMIVSVVAQVGPCGPPAEAGKLCTGVYDLTGHETLARAADVFLAKPAKLGLILLLAWLAAKLARRAIRRFTRGLGHVRVDVGTAVERSAGTLLRTQPSTTRATQRAETVGALLGSVASFLIWTVGILMALGELGLQLGPLLAGAGIVGVAVGFGAQNLVRDFLSGIFMLIEDQYGVGDVIDAGPASGTVEGVSLRTTRLRDIEGNVWHIPNGTIARVANKSQQWSRSLLDLPVPYDTDTDKALALMRQVAAEIWHDDEWSDAILEEPEVWGVENLGKDALTIRLAAKTKPLMQWKVGREIRRRVKAGFDAEGIAISSPQRMVWERSAADEEVLIHSR
jgi:small-conductance mechanosensitive channel